MVREKNDFIQDSSASCLSLPSKGFPLCPAVRFGDEPGSDTEDVSAPTVRGDFAQRLHTATSGGFYQRSGRPRNWGGHRCFTVKCAIGVTATSKVPLNEQLELAV